jgi:hypothetical protein
VPSSGGKLDFTLWAKDEFVIAITGEHDFDLAEAERVYRSRHGVAGRNVVVLLAELGL